MAAPTPPQKAANADWLKGHPNWTADRKALAAKNAAAKTKTTDKTKSTTTTINTRPGIGNTLADYLTLKSKLFDPAQEMTAAKAFAETQLPSQKSITDANTQRETVTSNVGGELLKALAGIQLAGISSADGSLQSFTQGATAANDAAAGQAAAAGGVVAPSTVTGVHDALGRVAANTNNILAGQQAGAAKSINLYHKQNASDLATTIANRNTDAAKLAAQQFESQQGRDSTDLSNLLTYNLYNAQNTTKRVIAKGTLALNKSIAGQKAAAKVIDQGIAQQRADTAKLVANGKISKDQADKLGKMYKAVEDVYNHQTAGAGAAGKTSHKVVVAQMVKVAATTGGPLNDGKDRHSQQIYNEVPKNVTLTIPDSQWQQFQNSGPMGQRKLALLGAQPGAKLVSESATTTGGKATSAWTPRQSKQVLVAAGFAPAQVAAIIKTLSVAGTPAGQAAAQSLLTQLPKWITSGIPTATLPPPPQPTFTPGATGP